MTVRINGVNYDFFNEFSIDRNYDSIGSSFAFSALFEPTSATHKNIFKPFSYPLVEVFENNKLICTGYIVSNKFNSSSKKKLTPIMGYSKTGFLEDCDVPSTAYPLSFNNLGIREVAEKLCTPFGITVVVDPSVSVIVDETYEQIETENIKSIKSFLTDLANQKNLLISHTVKGELLITKTNTGKTPIANIENSGSGYNLTLNCDGRKMYSNNLVMQDADVDSDNAGESEIINPYVLRFRSKTYTQDAGDNNATSTVARNVLSTQLKAISLSIETNSLFWNNGVLIEPNQIITVKDPDLYLFSKTKFFVQSVKMKGNAKKTTTNIVCVPLEVYNEEEVKSIF